MTTEHVRPNYVLIWLYLFVLTVAEVALAFELPISRNIKLLLLLALAVWKALLVAMFFMHLKFERWRLRSNLRCMKNMATSKAFHTASASKSSSLMLREIGSSKASATSATVSTNRYSQIST